MNSSRFQRFLNFFTPQGGTLPRALIYWPAFFMGSWLLPLLLGHWSPRWGHTKAWIFLSEMMVLLSLWQCQFRARQFIDAAISRRWLNGTVAVVSLSLIFDAVGLWKSFHLNAWDFGLFVEILDHTGQARFGDFTRFMWTALCNCNHWTVHQYYILLPLVWGLKIFHTPWFLVILHPLVFTMGIPFLIKMLEHKKIGTWGQLFFVAAYVGNGWSASILNYGFHPEVFFLPLGLAFFYYWEAAHWWGTVLAFLGFCAVKEDGALYMATFFCAQLLLEKAHRRRALGLLLLSAFFFYFEKVLAPAGWPEFFKNGVITPQYLSFWPQYGSHFGEIALGWLRHPGRVIQDIASSGAVAFFGAALLLPLLQPIALIAFIPHILILGTSTSMAMHHFGLYYAAPMLPLFFWSMLRVLDHSLLGKLGEKRYGIWLLALISWTLVNGADLRFAFQLANTQEWTAFHTLKNQLITTPNQPLICVQSSLYAHLVLDLPIQPLSLECARSPSSWVIISSRNDPFPLAQDEVMQLCKQKAKKEDFGEGLYWCKNP